MARVRIRRLRPALAALWLAVPLLGGCWIVHDDYEIDLSIEIVDPDPVPASGYAAFVFVVESINCATNEYWWPEATLLGWDSVESPTSVTVDGYHDAGGDSCFSGIYLGAYRDTDHFGRVDYSPGDACAIAPLSDPTVRATPIPLELSQEHCFDEYYWGEASEDRP